MRTGAVILGTCVSAVLLAAAGVLYLLAQNNGSEHYRKSIDLVRQIQLVSSDWSMEVTRVRSNPLADFDSLAAFIPRMARLKESLSDTAQRIPGLPDRLASDIQAYLAAIEAREERVERFKTGYAVVRNSNRYLPIAAANVLSQARDTNDEKLAASISALTRDVNLYLATPTEIAQSRIASGIRKLREASVAYPPALANALANLYSHAEVLVAKQGPTEQLFAQATSADISDLTNQLSDAMEFEVGKREALASWYERGMLAVFALLVLFWILLALQQRMRGGTADARVAARMAAAELEPAPEAAAAAAAGAAESVAEAGPAPVPAASSALDAGSRAPPAPAPESPRHTEADAALLHGFVVKSLAGILAASAEEVSGRMDYLRRTQQRIRDAVGDGGAVAGLDSEVDVEEEIETVGGIAMNVRQRMNAIADLARRLDSFAGAPANHVDRGMIDLNACVENAIATVAAGSDATIVSNLGDVPEIFASTADFETLLGELLDNSIAAVRGLEDRKGIVKVDTARKDDEILITIIDNGAGIPPEQRANVFKPFYTSRDGAMGIGLAFAGHLARKYDGVIKINSLPGQGTVARVTLPAGIAAP
ncbi:MAG: ATP-binding protein [Defluviicoccus sp.]|nr:ATP-binding protein [Defluviicoccus sp.]